MHSINSAGNVLRKSPTETAPTFTARWLILIWRKALVSWLDLEHSVYISYIFSDTHTHTHTHTQLHTQTQVLRCKFHPFVIHRLNHRIRLPLIHVKLFILFFLFINFLKTLFHFFSTITSEFSKLHLFMPISYFVDFNDWISAVLVLPLQFSFVKWSKRRACFFLEIIVYFTLFDSLTTLWTLPNP